jgi:hypothetical protein
VANANSVATSHALRRDQGGKGPNNAGAEDGPVKSLPSPCKAK